MITEPDPMRLVGLYLPSSGDVCGYLLGQFDDGWAIVASHVSSGGSWSKADIASHAARLPHLPYEWVGAVPAREVNERYPRRPDPPQTITLDLDHAHYVLAVARLTTDLTPAERNALDALARAIENPNNTQEQ